MRSVLALWRDERRARWFFAAHLQGGLGTGAGYVALLLLAYERIGSAWAASAVLLADLLPAMLLGPWLGRLIDRSSRLSCAVAADVVRAAAFGGIVLAPGTGAMVALAAVAGTGTALFVPSTAALLPSLVPSERLPAANALLGAVRETGQLLGPAVAAGLLLVAGPELVLAVNAAAFALSALLLTRLRGAVRPIETSAREAAAPTPAGGESLGTALAAPVVRTLMCASGAVLLVSGMMNVAELVLARQDLGVGGSGFALMVAAYGCGLVGGSLLVARERDEAGLRRGYLRGMCLMGLGLLGSAVAPTLPIAVLTFAVTGFGNGRFFVSDRTLLQRLIPERLHGRAFGVLDAIDSWGFAGALLAGGVLAGTAGPRVTFAVAGAGALVMWLAVSRVLMRGERFVPVGAH